MMEAVAFPTPPEPTAPEAASKTLVESPSAADTSPSDYMGPTENGKDEEDGSPTDATEAQSGISVEGGDGIAQGKVAAEDLVSVSDGVPAVTRKSPAPAELGTPRSPAKDTQNGVTEKAKVSTSKAVSSTGGPVFKPRTTSLHPSISATQPSSPVNPTPETNTWSTFLKSHATMLGISYPFAQDDDESGTVSGQNGTDRPSRHIVQGAHRPSRPDALLSNLDPESAEFLLARLDIENQALALNPKTIYVEDGNVRGYQPTLSALTTELNSYSTTAPGDMDKGDTEFWNSIVEGYGTIVHKIPHLLTARIRGGIPPHLRAKIWTTMSGAQVEHFESLYPLLLKEESPYERIIRRDIPRTYPRLDMFKEDGGEGQEKLFRLLKGYSIYDSEVGYCQGLSFVVGPLLLQNMSEVEAFAVLVRLMEDKKPTTSRSPPDSHRVYGLRTLFEPAMSGLHKVLFQHTELVREHLPKLHAHFQTCGITAAMYASQWFLTLYTYNFPLSFVFRIFDIIFAEGAIETMLRFSIAILKKNEPLLLKEEEFENVLDVLKGDRLFAAYNNDAEAVVQDMQDVQDLVSASILVELSSRFTADQDSRAKTVTETELLGLQALIKQLRADNTRLHQNVTQTQQEKAKMQSDMRELRRKLEETDRDLMEKDNECRQLKGRLAKLVSSSGDPQTSTGTVNDGVL
ncbi:rab-GTPase-TBC domain-containing protein [Fimicolochytrium jonesii]|uniref:rab-GTPase-TBC domain-containing protein n=1 Tax=Fimicolochytrium jonesii TaxID=1396493 RepID=UPI0022FDDE93|nr:rab-GTPase-TBC domain-containing protein [Fimicolochytrium jonesii]KAI8816811.1 rab-GTPase-TBC domain-containing protein [Fimicolochytrium jonesii]